MLKTKTIALGVAAVLAFGIGLQLGGPAFAQQAAGDGKKQEKVAKDQAEADLINGLAKEKDPKKQIEALEKWKKDYPDTAFADERRQAFLVAYAQLQDCRNASKAARDILAVNPTHDLSLRVLASCIYSIKGATDDEYDAAEKAAHALVDHPSKAADNQMTDAQWADFILLCKNVTPFIDIQKKNDEIGRAHV